jgi:hypothetical protein
MNSGKLISCDNSNLERYRNMKKLKRYCIKCKKWKVIDKFFWLMQLHEECVTCSFPTEKQ